MKIREITVKFAILAAFIFSAKIL